MNKVIFSKTATNNLISYALYIFEQTQSADLSDTYLDEMKDYIVTMLSTFPKAGRPSEEILAGSRKLVYQGYSILYRIEYEQIEILTIFRENLPKI